MSKKIVCFKCGEELKTVHEKDNDIDTDTDICSIPLISRGGFARLTFGFGSIFDGGGYGRKGDWADNNAIPKRFAKILESDMMLVPICDDCFCDHYKDLVVFNKKEKIEYKRIQ